MKKHIEKVTNKKFKLLDANTTIKELFLETVVNFIYGFVGNTITVFITQQKPFALVVNYLLFYLLLSFIVNRDKYETKLGKLVVLPIPATVGAMVGYYFAIYISNLI